MLFSREILFKIPFYKNIWGSGKLKKLWPNYWWLEQFFRLFLLSWLGVFLVYRLGLLGFIGEIGLLQPIWKGLLFSLIVTSPMIIFPVINRVPVAKINVERTIFGSAIWPMAEEIAFRGFAFGLLYKSTADKGWGMWLAILITGVLFGVVHLAQESVQKLPANSKIFTIAIISLGGILYAWLYVQWDMNLWIPIGVHGFMNLWWELFDRSGSAKGGALSNFTRELSAILAVVFTIFQGQLLPFL
jgi:membrane protease YdiL (CAAX protease family)